MATGYFDHNATTPLCPEAKEAWLNAQDDLWLNPSSPYRASACVHAHLESAREQLARLFEVLPFRVVFNSGATEGIMQSLLIGRRLYRRRELSG